MPFALLKENDDDDDADDDDDDDDDEQPSQPAQTEEETLVNTFMSQFKHKKEKVFNDSMRLSVQVMPQLMNREIENKDARTTCGFFELTSLEWYDEHKTSDHPIKVGNYVVPYSGSNNKRPRDPRATELMTVHPTPFPKEFFRRRNLLKQKF